METSKQARIKVRPTRLPRDITYIFPLLSVILILKTIKKMNESNVECFSETKLTYATNNFMGGK